MSPHDEDDDKIDEEGNDDFENQDDNKDDEGDTVFTKISSILNIVISRTFRV